MTRFCKTHPNELCKVYLIVQIIIASDLSQRQMIHPQVWSWVKLVHHINFALIHLRKQKKKLVLIGSLEESSIIKRTFTMNKLLRSITYRVSVSQLNMSRYLNKEPGWEEDCFELAHSFATNGCSYVHDPRVNYTLSPQLVSELQKYYAFKSQQLENGELVEDMGRDLEADFPVGLQRHNKAIMPQNLQARQSLREGHKSFTSTTETIYDPTMRVRWLIGSRYNVDMSQFPKIEETFNVLGKQQFECVQAVSEMLCFGLGLKADAIKELFENGNKLYGPPGSNLQKQKVGDILNPFHYDFGLFTIHNKGRFPGLYFWAPDGTRFQPKIPDQHFLIHGGKQLQWLTGGFLKSPFHEVVYNDELQKVKVELEKRNESTWRVAVPMFTTIDNKKFLKPLGHFATDEAVNEYPSMTSQDWYKLQMSTYLPKQ